MKNFKVQWFMWAVVAFLWVLFWGVLSKAHAQYTYESSPYNPKNSEYNYNNSQYNYNNSPYNPKNSEYNYGNKNANGVYDTTGNRVGYVVESPEGTRNYFTNDGTRIGYGRTR